MMTSCRHYIFTAQQFTDRWYQDCPSDVTTLQVPRSRSGLRWLIGAQPPQRVLRISHGIEARAERSVARCDDDVRTSGHGVGMMRVRIIHHKVHELRNVCEAALRGHRTDVDRAVTETHLYMNGRTIRARHLEGCFEAEVLMEPCGR